MNLFRYLSLAILMLHAALASAQVISWEKDRPLSWSDFKHRAPQKPKRFVAATYSSIRYDLNVQRPDSFYPVIKSVFYAEKSWTRSQHYRLYILKHEQTHFDITELYACKMRYAVSACKHWYNHAGVYRDARLIRIYHRYRRKCRFAQKWYDFQTRHSRKKARQLEWNDKVSSLLKAYGH